MWDNLFSQLEQPIAQILLTRGDIADVSLLPLFFWPPFAPPTSSPDLFLARTQRTRYLNAVNTFTELLSMGVVPIVNENDTVSVSVSSSTPSSPFPSLPSSSRLQQLISSLSRLTRKSNLETTTPSLPSLPTWCAYPPLRRFSLRSASTADSTSLSLLSPFSPRFTPTTSF